jgi:hypothetical protein
MRVDSGKVSAPPKGKVYTGWDIPYDQEDPKRMAGFDLDGSSGFTADGIHWKSISVNGVQNSRGWDMASLDWATPDVKVMLALNHEASGAIYKTTDGGATWQKLSVSALPARPGAATSMIGVMDATTFIYSNGNGISRSTDQGATWAQVSTVNPLAMTPMMFKGTAYLGTATGLLVSKDKGASWQLQGASLNIYQGPFFGADEKAMVVVGLQGVYKSTNAGAAWTKVAPICPPIAGNTFYTFEPSWFGCYSWDPINDIVYATAETNPAFKYQLSPTRVDGRHSKNTPAEEVTIANGTVRSGALFNNLAIFSLNGMLLYDRPVAPSHSASIPEFVRDARSTLVYRITTTLGTVHQLLR